MIGAPYNRCKCDHKIIDHAQDRGGNYVGNCLIFDCLCKQCTPKNFCNERYAKKVEEKWKKLDPSYTL